MQEASSHDQGLTKENGTVSKVDPGSAQSADVLGDLLGPLAIEGPPAAAVSAEQNIISGLDATPDAAGALALATVGDQSNSVQVSNNFSMPSTFPAFQILDTSIILFLAYNMQIILHSIF